MPGREQVQVQVQVQEQEPEPEPGLEPVRGLEPGRGQELVRGPEQEPVLERVQEPEPEPERERQREQERQQRGRGPGPGRQQERGQQQEPGRQRRPSVRPQQGREPRPLVRRPGRPRPLGRQVRQRGRPVPRWWSGHRLRCSSAPTRSLHPPCSGAPYRQWSGRGRRRHRGWIRSPWHSAAPWRAPSLRSPRWPRYRPPTGPCVPGEACAEAGNAHRRPPPPSSRSTHLPVLPRRHQQRLSQPQQSLRAQPVVGVAVVAAVPTSLHRPAAPPEPAARAWLTQPAQRAAALPALGEPTKGAVAQVAPGRRQTTAPDHGSHASGRCVLRGRVHSCQPQFSTLIRPPSTVA